MCVASLSSDGSGSHFLLHPSTHAKLFFGCVLRVPPPKRGETFFELNSHMNATIGNVFGGNFVNDMIAAGGKIYVV